MEMRLTLDSGLTLRELSRTSSFNTLLATNSRLEVELALDSRLITFFLVILLPSTLCAVGDVDGAETLIFRRVGPCPALKGWLFPGICLPGVFEGVGIVGMSSVRSICSVSGSFMRSTISFFWSRAGYGSVGVIGVGLRSTKKSSLSLLSAHAGACILTTSGDVVEFIDGRRV